MINEAAELKVILDHVFVPGSQTNYFPKKRNWCRKFKCLFRILTFGHGVPFASVIYYSLGAVGFGVLRGRDTVSTVMYPLDFTTSGGLDQIKGHVRFIYGLFVEGAMLLLACMLASLRRRSSRAIARATQRYRLFVAEKCAHCVESVMNIVPH